LVLPLLLLLLISPRLTDPWPALWLGALWLSLNLLWSLLNSGATVAATAAWYRQPLRAGNHAFVLYLLILTGYFTAYMQLFITMPLYLRDYVNTADLVQLLAHWLPGSLDYLAAVNVTQLADALPGFATQYQQALPDQQAIEAVLAEISRQLAHHKIQLPTAVLAQGLTALQLQQTDAHVLASDWRALYRQINPEYIVNLGFLTIVLCQIAISRFIMRWQALPVLVGGTVLLAFGLMLCGLSATSASGGLLAIAGVWLFSVGEMVTSPKSQEYVAAIAPPRQTAMYMGYYFVSMALGNLFAGLLSGWAYGYFGAEMQQPVLMWYLFGAIAVLTAGALCLFQLGLSRKTGSV
jgi:hypothetical protein